MRGSRPAVIGSTLLVLLLLALSPGQAQEGIQAPLGGAFTFQGYLSAAGAPIEDTCDFRFGLWDAATGGVQVGATLDQGGVAVEQGRFTVLLDFGPVFDGTALWLETAVRCTGEPDYTTLAPRQALTAAPYALGVAWTGLYSVPAGFADDVDNDVLGGLACGGGQVAKWDGAAWSCAPDEGTAYSAGEGLVLTGTVFSADTDYLQRRAAPCGDGYAIRAINQDGTVVCALIDNTVYEAGFGLVLSGTTFLADPAVLQQRVTATCGAGSSIRQVNQDGTVVCEPDDDTLYEAGFGLVLSGTTFLADPTVVQARITATCGAGSSIRQVNEDGTVVCEPDDDTLYEAGTGLILSGTTFLPDPTYLQRRVAPCGASYAIQAVNEDGSVVCQVVDNTTYDAGVGLYLAGTTFGITTTYRLPQGCSGTEIAKWNGSTWACAADNDTTYSAGTGLNLAGTTFSLLAGYRLPQACANGEIPEWNGAAWACGADDVIDADADPTNELNTALGLAGNTLTITDAGGILQVDLTPLVDDADADPTNELNTAVVLNGTSLEITDAGGTLIADLTSLVDDADADPTNELNVAFALNGTTLVITDAGGALTSDLSTLDTLANLSCGSGQVAKWNGSTWACAADNDTTYTAGTGLNLAGTTFSILASYQLPQACTGNQIPKWNGSTWACAADNDTTYTAGTGLNLAGTTFSLLAAYRLPQGCAGTQIARWDGAAWICSSDVGVTDHGALSGLGDDDHPQYVHTTTARTISAVHTFNPAAAGAPFILGANAAGQLVAGLNADLLDGRTTGAAAGNIPVNNGALNVTLNADQLDNLHAVDFAGASHNHWGQTWSGAGTGLTLNSTSGTGLAGSGTTYGLWGASGAAGGYGVYGSNTAGGYGVYGASSGTAVRADGGAYGVYADGSSTAVYGTGGAYGVYGTGTSTAVYGGGGTCGVYGSGTYGTFGTGTYGAYGNGSSYGVWGSSSATAVYGGGGTYGVYATGTYGTYGTGTYGAYGTGSTYGVWGTSSATAVRGAGGTYGVYGSGTYGAYGTGTGYGVYGSSSATAVYGGGGTYGVYGSGTYGAYGTGTYGAYGSGSSYGVYGSSSATAVYGGGGTYGVYGTGIYGAYGSGSSYGVVGSSSNTAVYGSGGTYGLYASGTYGVYGAGTYGVYGSGSYGVYGTGSYGVYATGTSTAVYAGGTATYGVYATGSSTAIYAYTAGPTSIYGESSYASGNAYGVFGNATGANPQNAGVYGRSVSTLGYGLAGHNYWSGVGVGAWSYTGDIYRGYSGDWPGGTLRFWVDQSGNVHYDGGLMPYSIFPTPDGREEVRSLYVTESPEPWSEDAGTAELVDGQAVVTIDPLYAQTVDTTADYHVFLTPLGDCPLYVADKTATSFTVQAMGGQACSIAFDYRLLLKPQGTAGQRMEVLDVDLGTPSPEKTEPEATP